MKVTKSDLLSGYYSLSSKQVSSMQGQDGDLTLMLLLIGTKMQVISFGYL